MKFGQKQTIRQKGDMVEKKYGKTLGDSKGKAPVSGKPTIKPSGTNPLKRRIGVKATWKF